MNKSTELSKTQKPANCGYTVLPAVFCQQVAHNGWRYEIEADCERLTISHHESLNVGQSPKIALKPLCFIPCVMVSCFVS